MKIIPDNNYRNNIKKYFHFKSSPENLKIQNIIRPLYLLTSFVGLFPYNIKYLNTKQRFIIIKKSIYVNTVTGVSIVVLVLTFLGLHIREVMLSTETSTMTEVIMTQMNYMLELVTLVIFCVATYTVAFFNRENYITMFNTIVTIWVELPQVKKSGKILSQLHFQISILTTSLLLAIAILQLCVNFSRENSIWKMILVTITFNLPQMIQFITLAFYYNLVMMVVAVLSNINEQCKELVKGRMHAFISVKPSEITLRKLELVYIKAFEVKASINKAFQAPILASTIQCFHSIVSEAHIIYHGAVNKSVSTHDVVNCSIWIMYQVLKIYALAYSGNLLKIKVLKIGQTLHNIPIERQDMILLMEIQHFSTLMKYQEIEITVYGYFPLDATLIYNVLTSAMMYLIILVQFDKKV